MRPVTLLLICSLAPSCAMADVVTDWNAMALQAVTATAGGPPPTTRNLAMMSVAMHNAVNNAGLYGGPTSGSSLVDRSLAAAQAARDVLAAQYPSRTAVFDAALNAHIAGVADPAVRAASIAFGQQQASHVLTLRANDGAGAPSTHAPSNQPGRYQYTQPGQTGAAFQQYASTTPWNLVSPSQYRPGPPPALTSAQYAAELQQVQQLGASASAIRTAYQTETARFWAAGGGTVTPPGMWNDIARGLSQSQHFSTEQNALLFAALNTAMADAAIACWDSKVVFDFWRPMTAIQQADSDGNDATNADPTWTPLIATPPFQAYVSGHSTFSASAATVLAQIFGTDAMLFDVTSQGTGTTRSYNSLWAAAEEAGMSRIYGGIHFMSDNTAGLELGRLVGLTAMSIIPAPASAAVMVLGCAGLIGRRRAASGR